MAQKIELARLAVSGSGSLVGAPRRGSGEFMGVVHDYHGIHGVYATGL